MFMLLNINIVIVCVLDVFGIEMVVVFDVGCCGVICLYLNYYDEVFDDVCCNIDVWWFYVE